MATARELIEQIRAGGKEPSPDWISRRTGMSIEEAKNVIDGLQIEVPTNKPKVAPTKLAKDPISATVGKSIPEPPKRKKSAREYIQNVLIALLPFIFAGAAVAGSIRSYTMAYSFFARINNSLDASLFAGLLVAISFATPQAVPILWPEVKKGKRIPMFLIALLVSVTAIGTNMSITVIELGQQRGDSNTVQTANVELKTQLKARIEELAKDIESIKADITSDSRERSILLDMQRSLEVGSADYNRTRDNLAVIKSRIDRGIIARDSATKELGKARLDLMAIPASGVVIDNDSEKYINLAVAFILEIGSPLALSLSLFL